MGNDSLKLFRLIFETALFVGFFHGIKPQKITSTLRKVLSFTPLTLLFSLYFLDFLFPNIVLRFFLRFVVFFIYLILLKSISWQKSVYFSGISSSAYYSLQNIFITPLVYPFFIKNFFIVYLAFLLLFMLLYFSISFDNIKHIGADRFIMLISVISCILYVKYSLSIMIDGVFVKNIEMTIFPILLQLFLIVSILLFEKYLYARKQREEARLHEVITEYKFQNIKNKVSAEDNLRILTHDMKNHFIAIKKLVDTSNYFQIKDYINELILTTDTNNKYVQTGNEFFDGFITEKIAEAEKFNIDFSIIIDFKPIFFISDIDICTIFGNSIDNAIEACKNIPNFSNRYIQVYISSNAGYMSISFVNSYLGKLKKKNGLLLTTKKLSQNHGFGLSSISKTIQKYNGFISINTDTENKFVLTLMFPISDS